MIDMLKVEGTKIRFKCDHDGPQVSLDGGETWEFTFRSEAEFCEMWKNRIITGQIPQHDDDLEIFGDTLDEPIPEDFVDILLD